MKALCREHHSLEHSEGSFHFKVVEDDRPVRQRETFEHAEGSSTPVLVIADPSAGSSGSS